MTLMMQPLVGFASCHTCRAQGTCTGINTPLTSLIMNAFVQTIYLENKR